MALMSDIISKYQRQANQRIAEARNCPATAAVKQENQELLNSIVINQGAGKFIPPEVSSDGNIFEAAKRNAVRVQNKFGAQGQQAMAAPRAETVVYNPSSNSEYTAAHDIFKELDILRAENRKLKAELELLKSGQKQL